MASMAEAALRGTMESHLRNQGKVYVVLREPSGVEDSQLESDPSRLVSSYCDPFLCPWKGN